MPLLNVGEYVKVRDKWYRVILSPRAVLDYNESRCKDCSLVRHTLVNGICSKPLTVVSCYDTIGRIACFREVDYEEVQKSANRKVEITKTGEIRDLD